MNTAKKCTGIWLDAKQAFIYLIEDQKIKPFSIASPIEDFHVVGGSRSKVPWGPMEKISEKKYEERRKLQIKKYFESILNLIGEQDSVYLFGPAEIKLKLNDEILGHHKYRNTKVVVATAGKMTENQKIAQVRAFFKIPVQTGS